MNCTRRDFLGLAATGALGTLAACGRGAGDADVTAATTGASVDLGEFKKLALGMDEWCYDEDADVWYQTGLTYCLDPATEAYEQLAIFVPGAYLTGKGDGKRYSCEVNEKGKVGDFTSSTAPFVMPLNAANFSGQAATTSYSYEGLADYLKAGLIYVYVGFRGRNNGYDSATSDFFSGGAPWAVTDLKAAIRYLRYNAGVLPGDADRVFAFGLAAGGELAAILGASGDAAAYDRYLDKIGAATHDAKGNELSDALLGSASWCPTASFDSADSAYEWSMGQYCSTVTRAEKTWTEQLSRDLAVDYAGYVNKLALVDDDDTALSLDETSGGTYVAGTYYEHVLGVVRDAASAFFKDLMFPYVPDTAEQAAGNFGGDGNLKASEEEAIAKATDGDALGSDAAPAVSFKDVDSYLASLNDDYAWITYNESKHEVSITDLASFVRHCRPAARDVCAFDSIDRDQPANQLFGNDTDDSAHFDGTILALLTQNTDAYAKLTGWDEKYLTEWKDDLSVEDALEVPVPDRVRMYDPLFYLSGHYEDGFGTATVAPYWRINTGLSQTGVPLTGEINLVCALRAYDGVSKVDFTPVWGRGCALVERSGKAVENLITWITTSCSKSGKKSK